MKMTVFKLNEDGSKRYEEIDITNVDFLQKEGTRIAFYMEGQKYLSIINVEELNEILMEFGFDRLDQSNLVNMKKIRGYDDEDRKVYFEEEPNKNSYYANLANVKKRHLEPYIYRAIAKNKGTTLENVKKQGKSFSLRGILPQQKK
jgi:DNA-binding LytR/AlgR family response regulator